MVIFAMLNLHAKHANGSSLRLFLVGSFGNVSIHNAKPAKGSLCPHDADIMMRTIAREKAYQINITLPLGSSQRQCIEISPGKHDLADAGPLRTLEIAGHWLTTGTM